MVENRPPVRSATVALPTASSRLPGVPQIVTRLQQESEANEVEDFMKQLRAA